MFVSGGGRRRRDSMLTTGPVHAGIGIGPQSEGRLTPETGIGPLKIAKNPRKMALNFATRLRTQLKLYQRMDFARSINSLEKTPQCEIQGSVNPP